MELDGKGIDPAYEFEYLGWWVNADGDKRVGLERRMEAAADRYSGDIRTNTPLPT